MWRPAAAFPSLRERVGVLDGIRGHLPLPYSVAEYACGAMADLVVAHLLRHGFAIWAVKRCLILERDLSPAALEEVEVRCRPGALVVDNPLYRLGDLNDPMLRGMLETLLA